MRDDKKNVIIDLSFEFALKIIVFAEELEERKKYVISRQLLKSGTSIGANIHEAQNAESRVDFIHKLKIAAKEADETSYWPKLCEAAPSYPSIGQLLKELSGVIKVLSKIIGTTKRNHPSSN